MPSSEEINKRCLVVCQVPVDLSRDIVCNHVKRHFQYGRILDTDKVDEIESRTHFTRFVLLCSSAEDVDYICKEVKEEKIKIDDRCVQLKYQKSKVCELPGRWEDAQVPEHDKMQPSYSVGSIQEPQQSHVRPEPPPRKPDQPKPTGGKQQQLPSNAWPPGPYGPMSGFYQNIPLSSEGDCDGNQKMNKDGMPQHMPMYGHGLGQLPTQGTDQKKGHHPAFTEQYQSLGNGQAHGPQQTVHPSQIFPFGRGHCQPGHPAFAMPRHYPTGQQNIPGGQNMPFQHGMPMPMFIDPQTGQLLPMPVAGFPKMPNQQVDDGVGQRQQPTWQHSSYDGVVFKEQNQYYSTGAKSATDIFSSVENDHQSDAMIKEAKDKRTEEQEMQEEKARKILVSNLPSTAHEGYLELFFENAKKFGSGITVINVDLDKDNITAIVEFDEPEGVDVILSKCPVIMMGKEVEVIVYQPEPPAPLCTIEVTGPCSVVSEEQLEMLEMYFESESRSGGGDIVDSKFDSGMNMALITFEREEVAKRVEERGRHIIKKEKLTVCLHTPTQQSKKPDKTEDIMENKANASKTIKVTGVDKLASKDTVEFYFENSRRSGGGEIENIKSDEENEDAIYITFKDKQDAINVVKRGLHTVEGKELYVSLYVPPISPPSYENKIIIKGLKPTTTQDCLFNFIEAKTEYSPETVDYHAEQEDVVMVTFKDSPDIQELETIFGNNKLEGASLKVCPVPVSNCIIVANLTSDVTEDTVSFYFENTRKSGGGQVDKVVMNEDDTFLVYFADYTIIDRVIDRKHELSKQQLDVKRYQECLGRPEGEVCERKLNIPDPLKMKNVSPNKLKFLKHSKFGHEALEKEMMNCHARVLVPSDGRGVTLECTLTNDVETCFKRVKTWEKEAKECFDHFLNTISVHQISVLQDVWDKVLERLKSITIKSPETVAVFVDENERFITVVGDETPAESHAKKLQKVVEEAEMEQQKVKETFSSLKSSETRLLLADNFQTKVEKMFPELKVKINKEKNEIVFEGSIANVRDAKLKLYEIKSEYAQRCIENISTHSAELFKDKHTKDYIVKKLKMQRVTGVWEIQDHTLIIFSSSEQTIDHCVSIIRESLVEKSIRLTKASTSVMNSEAWQRQVEELHSQHYGKAHITVDDSMTKVVISSTDDIAKNILDGVKSFLGSNVVLEETVQCNKHLHKLVEKHHKNAISEICKQLRSYHVTITSEGYGGCRICGTEDGIIRSKELLNNLFDKVKQKDHKTVKPGVLKETRKHRGQEDFSTTENSMLHIISVKDEWDEEQTSDTLYDRNSADKENRSKVIKVRSSCKAYGNRNVYTAVGEVTEMPVQVLVYAADEKRSLNEGLGKAMVLKGKLKADYIIDVIGPVWSGGVNNEEEILEEAVFKCMQQATTKDATSIALPAISCGAFGYPVKQGTRSIVKAVKNFFHEVQESQLTDVYLCDVKSHIVDSFTADLQNEFGNIQIEDQSEELHQQMAEMGSDDVNDDLYSSSNGHQKSFQGTVRDADQFMTTVPPVPPPPYHENKILIKGLKPTTTQECLFNFIEAKTGFIPDTMDFHAEQEDAVLVTFTENHDFQKLEKVFGNSKLEGASLKIYPVPRSNCIIVANLVSEVTKDTVEFYFENTRKSGGGQVDKVVMNEDETCLVYFADFSIVESVLERAHKLSGQKLDVKRYQECLGRSEEGEIPERTFRMPEEVVLKYVDSEKIKFMKHSNVNRSALERHLAQCYASITWPDESRHVVLTCTLTTEVKDFVKLVKQWKEKATQNFQDFMKNIIVKKVPVMQDIWSKVMEELKTLTLDNPKAVAIFVYKIESIIIVVGNKINAEGLAKKIDDITKKVMEKMEKKREKIKEVFTALNLIETKMLIADKFPTEMEKLFPDLKLKISQNKNEIVFEGPLGQVRDAKLKMYEIKSRFATASIDKVSNLAAGLFLLKQTKEHVVKKLKANRLTAVWDITDGCLVVCSTPDKQIQKCVNIIRGSVIENTIALKKASKTVVNSENWQTKVDELLAYNPGKCFIQVPDDASKVQICATDDIAMDILENVKKFLRLSTVTEVKIHCTRSAHRLIEKHHNIELQNIAKSLQHSHVQIISIPGYGGFEVQGTEDGIQKARAKMLALFKRVQQREHTMSKPGLAKHMQTPKGKDNLNTIESSLECVVSVKDGDNAEDSYDSTFDTVPADSGDDDDDVDDDFDSGNCVYKFGCVTVSVQQGDITAEKADCIVNSSNEALDLSRGKVSQALMKKGGKGLAAEVDKLKKKMKSDGIVVTSAPGLQCKHIIHIVAKETLHEWKKMIEKCLDTADKNQMKSIAFPALGTGVLMDASDMAETITKALLKFDKSQPSSIQEVKLVIYQQKMVEDFNEAIRKTVKSKEGWGVGKLVESVQGWWSGKEANRKDDGQYERPKMKKKSQIHTDPNTVTFIILALSEEIINQAIRKLEKCLDKEIHSKRFDDSIIMKMDDNQVMEIRAIAQQFHIEMQLESAKGHIQISGIASNVMSASDKIHRIMRDAVSLEQAKNSAALMSNLVQWSYIEIGETGQTLEPYDKDLNYKIENAYIAKAPNVKFSANNKKYVLDFNKMEEYPEDEPTDVVTVLRRDLVKQGAFEQPALWADMTGNLRVVVLQTTSQEYLDISQKFVASAGPGFTVIKVERVQNKTLWAQYQAKKKQLDDLNPPNTTNERLLWHGTAVETVDNINAHGFNRSYCGKNATMYGDGVYFAVNTQYSCRNNYSRPDTSGVKRMYYCRVLTGEYTQGKRGMRVTPNKGGAGSTALYDSVVDNPGGPGMYIIFHDTQAYPEYLVSFKPQ